MKNWKKGKKRWDAQIKEDAWCARISEERRGDWYVQIKDGIILESPKDTAHRKLYSQWMVIRTKRGRYFTTIRPCPRELQPYVVVDMKGETPLPPDRLRRQLVLKYYQEAQDQVKTAATGDLPKTGVSDSVDQPIHLESWPAPTAIASNDIPNSDPPSIPLESQHREGAMREVTLNSFERNPYARERCIAHYGCRCSVFWAMYIGNDGRANCLSMPGATEEVLEVRTYLWEHLYTLFESSALCWRLEGRLGRLTEINTPNDYADNLNSWIAFYAHLGRIHDMPEKAAGEFRGENLFAPFDLFYEQRHIVLHCPKVPMCLVENVLTAPYLGDKPKEWKKGMCWSELRHQDFQFLDLIFKCTLDELEKVINKFFFKITALAAPQKRFVPIQWPEAARAQGRNVPPADGLSSATSLLELVQHQVSPSGVAFVPPNV